MAIEAQLNSIERELGLLRQQMAELASTRSAASGPEYLGVGDAANFLNLSKALLDDWRSKGGGPDFIRVGRRVMYETAHLRAWMAERVEKAKQ